MINVKKNELSIDTDNLQQMMYDRALIKALAAQLVAGQVDLQVSNIADELEGEPTFSDVEMCMLTARERVVDYVEDLLTEFRDMLHEELRQVEVSVASVNIGRFGVESVDVNIG